MDLEPIEILLRVLGAAAAGAVVGLERDLRGHPAGTRTHALVSAGAALFALSGALWGDGDVGTDSSRAAAQVVTGIGFIGAGAIIQDRFDVRGLTTAATIWVAGGMGVAAASGSLALVLSGLAVVVFVLVLLRPLRRLVSRRLSYQDVSVDLVYERGHGTLGPVMQAVDESSASLKSLSIDDERDIRTRQVSIELSIEHGTLAVVQKAMATVAGRDEIRVLNVRLN